jgi:hypothetical protein
MEELRVISKDNKGVEGIVSGVEWGVYEDKR